MDATSLFEISVFNLSQHSCYVCTWLFYFLFLLKLTSPLGLLGATKQEGGGREVLPLSIEGRKNVLAMLKEEHKTF